MHKTTTRLRLVAIAAILMTTSSPVLAQSDDALDEHHPEAAAEADRTTPEAAAGQDGGAMGMMGPQMMQMMQQMMPQMMLHMMQHAMTMPDHSQGTAGMGMSMMPGQAGNGPSMPMCPMAMPGGAVIMMPMMPGQMASSGTPEVTQGIGPDAIYGLPSTSAAELSVDDVVVAVERMLAWHGNPRLTIGEVVPTDAGEIIAEIVTQDGSLVQKLAFDRHTRAIRQVY